MTTTPGRLGPLLLLLGLAGLVPTASAGDPSGLNLADSYDAGAYWQRFCSQHRVKRLHYTSRLVPRTEFVVCADLTPEQGYRGPSTWNRAEHPVPHSEIVLVVRKRPEQTWTAAAKGTRGIYVASVLGSSPPADRSSAPPATADAALASLTKAAGLLKVGPVKTEVDAVLKSIRTTPGESAALVSRLEQLKEKLSALTAKDSDASSVRAYVDEALGLVSAPQHQIVNFHRFAPGQVTVELVVDGTSVADLVAALTSLDAQVQSVLAIQAKAGTAEAIARAQDLRSRLSVLRGTLAARDTVRAGPAGVAAKQLAEVSSLWSSAAADASRLGPATDALDKLLVGELAVLGQPKTLQPAVLQVEPTYVGAFRVGLGIGVAPERDYAVAAATPAAGTETYVVQERSRGPWTLDLVLGYSQMMSRRPASAASPTIALSGGFAIASLQDGQPKVFDMAYLGPELAWRQFGLTAAFTLRRTERLRDGLKVGDAVRGPLTDEADLTTNVFVPGVSLVLYPFELIRVGESK